jgi:hypothetical protein
LIDRILDIDMITVAFESDEDAFGDGDTSVSRMLEDRDRFRETEIDDESILEAEFYRLVKYDDICPVPRHDGDRIEDEFIESILHLSSRDLMIDPGIREPHHEVEEHEHEESPSDEVESADHIFDIDDNGRENDLESSK